MAVISIDKLNALYDNSYKRRSIPYEQYFGEMDIPEEAKKKRILFSSELEEVFIFLLSLIAVASQYDYTNSGFIEREVVQRYSDLVSKHTQIDDYLNEHIKEIVQDVIRVTLENTDPYYQSEDRVMVISENEANAVFNYAEYRQAIKDNYTRKQWNTEFDAKVRKTHREVEKRIVNIEDAFLVGESLMLFPKDTSLGADAEEIVNCRCTVTYIK